jgi:NhaA family Na+:H+ antiporter
VASTAQRTVGAVAASVIRPIQRFVETEVAGGLVLVVAAVAALLWANLAPGGYEHFWSEELVVGWGDWSLTMKLESFVKNGLMVIFFFVVGLEIKRELTIGELADRKVATLPLFAAAGGMIVPALIYLAFTIPGGEGEQGWGIPMATDIAFALGAMALVSRRLPPELPAFLLAVAVFDDIGAIAVIAIVYTDALAVAWLGAAVGGLLAMWLLNRFGVTAILVYVLVGIGVWYAAYRSGVSPTLAGVAFGVLTPVAAARRAPAVREEAQRIADFCSSKERDHDVDEETWRSIGTLARDAVSPLERIERALHPWSAFAVLPIFALAEAGVRLDSETISAAFESAVTLGVIAGLVVGKPVGVMLGCLLALSLGLARFPSRVGWSHMAGVGLLAGIGFTVSIFVAGRAFTDTALVEGATIGILFGSVLAGVAGTLFLALGPGRGGARARSDARDAEPERSA